MYAIVLALWAIYEKTEDIMGRVVKNEKELVQEIQNNVDYIEVECGIKDFFIKIKGTRKIAWTVCLGCLAIAAATTTYMVAKEDTDAKKIAISAISATAAAAILGPTTAATCVMMAVSAGGVDVLRECPAYILLYLSLIHI